jgi:NhaA family Na+:H+ antiporter
LAGIGFTMSLFIGSLAFADPEHQNLIRIGVISGSILSGLVGASVLAFLGKSARVRVYEK